MLTHDKSLYYRRGFDRGSSLAGPTVISASTYWFDVARGLANLLDLPLPELTQTVVKFHHERMESVPDFSVYPELKGHDELLREYENGMRAAGVSDELLALAQSLNFWRDTRLVEETGKAWNVVPLPEKCRVLYAPHTDKGALHLKNIDDPMTYWSPQPAMQADSPWPMGQALVFDGVGSGLHLDEMPKEIYPVDALALSRDHCQTVDEVTEFLVRYNYFWSGQNLIVHDQSGNSVAFEKTRCRVATRGPNEAGINFITGMGALDPGIKAFQKQQRLKYLQQVGKSWDDTPDGRFWTISENTWDNMAHYVDDLTQNPTWDNCKQLMEQRDEKGPMCLTGESCHPDDVAPGCTLVMTLWEMDNKVAHRRQWRGQRPAYLDTPEIVAFA